MPDTNLIEQKIMTSVFISLGDQIHIFRYSIDVNVMVNVNNVNIGMNVC